MMKLRQLSKVFGIAKIERDVREINTTFELTAAIGSVYLASPYVFVSETDAQDCIEGILKSFTESLQTLKESYPEYDYKTVETEIDGRKYYITKRYYKGVPSDISYYVVDLFQASEIELTPQSIEQHLCKARRLDDDVEVVGYYTMNRVRPQPQYELYDSNQVHHYIETEYGDRYEIKPETLTEA